MFFFCFVGLLTTAPPSLVVFLSFPCIPRVVFLSLFEGIQGFFCCSWYFLFFPRRGFLCSPRNFQGTLQNAIFDVPCDPGMTTSWKLSRRRMRSVPGDPGNELSKTFRAPQKPLERQLLCLFLLLWKPPCWMKTNNVRQ